MANNRDVELRIRARDYSQKTLRQVTDAIQDLSRAQDEQKKSAERGETSVKELEASYRKLESAGQALLKLNSLVEVYKRQSAALEEQRTKLEAARVKQEELNKKYREAETVSKNMETQMGRANRALEAQTKRFADAEARVAKTTGELQRYGVATNNLGETQSKIVTNVARVNAALERQDKIINQAPASAKRAAAAALEQAKADEARAAAAAMAMGRTEEAAYAQNKIIDSLRRQADQALAAARGYQTLGRVVASLRLTSSGSNLAGEINQIVSPAQAARNTLQGLETQVNSLSRVTRDANGQLVGAASALRNLQAAQQSAIGMARLIDTFRHQVTAVRTARDEFRAARADVLNLAAQMRAATGDTAALGAQMQAAQQRLNGATNELRNASSAARAAQGALRGAGIDTQNLSAAEDRLRAASGSASRGVRDLTDALRQSGGAADEAGRKFNLFAENTRQSLSMVQRIRGELVGLATAYVGVQGAINLASGAIDIYKIRQQTMIKLGTVVGKDQAAQAAEWKYITDIAEDLGIKIQEVAKGYSTFAVAAKAVGLDMVETKKVFEAVSKAGRVYQLSADDMQGVFRAITQMLSKGTIMAEELTGQLAERITGAVARFAEGNNQSIPELLKAMQNSEVKSRAVLNYAYAQEKAISADVEAAKKGVAAMEARTQNAMAFFQLALADSGFIDKYIEMLHRITEYLNSPDGKEGAKTLGDAFSKVADAIIFCVDNADELIVVLQVLAGAKIIGLVATLAGQVAMLGRAIGLIGRIGDKVLLWLASFAASAGTATGAMGLLRLAAGLLVRALPGIGWWLTALSIGQILYDQSEIFRTACDDIIMQVKNLYNQLNALVQTPTAALRDLAYTIARPIAKMFSSTLNLIAKWIADVLRLIPGVGDGLADFALDVADNLTKENRDAFQNVKKIWDDVGKKWEDLNKKFVADHGKAMKDVMAQSAEASMKMQQSDIKAMSKLQYQKQEAGQGGDDRDRLIAKNQKAIEAAQKKADAEMWASREALMRKNLKGRLALVDEQFAPQVADAKKIGGDEGAKQLAELNKLIALRKASETNEYNASQRSKTGIDKRARAIEALTEKYNNLKASVEVTEVKQDPTSDLATRTQAALNKLALTYNEMRADAAKIGGKEGAQLTTQLNTLQQINNATLSNKMQLEEVTRLQNKVNDLMATRKARIDDINAKREAGVISEDEQVSGVVQVHQETKTPIESSLNELTAAAEAAKMLLGPEAFAQLMANIGMLRTSLKDVTGTYTVMAKGIVTGVLDAMSTAIDQIAQGIQDVVTGAKSMGEAFQSAGVAMAKFFADLLKQLAMAIIKQMILNALASMGGEAGSFKGTISSAAVSLGGKAGAAHNGGVIGSKTTGGMQQRGMNPQWFANAQRFHSGGLPGLKSDEVPTILQKGEEVLSKNNPNNILNQQRSTSGAAAPQNMRFVFVDDRAKVPEAMNTAEGEYAIMQILRRNAPSVRNIVKSNKGGRQG